MRWPWRRSTVQLIGGEVRGRTAASPLGVWADLGEGRISFTPAFDHFEGDIAVWLVMLPDLPLAMGADAYPPQTAIEWQMPGLAPWRHPDGRGW